MLTRFIKTQLVVFGVLIVDVTKVAGPAASALLYSSRSLAGISRFLSGRPLRENPVFARAWSGDAPIFLDDVTVSRHHAEFRYGAEGWSVRDVGSLNGTYVNRVRVDDQQLVGGDEVQIGKYRLVFHPSHRAS